MNGKRIGCLVLAAFAALFVGLFGGFYVGHIPPRDPITQAAAEAALNREEAIATSLGFAAASVPARALAVQESPRPFPISLSAGECVAVVAASWGHQQIRSVSIADGATGQVLVKDEPHHALAAQAQWCTDRAGSFRLVAELTPRDLYRRRVDGHVSVHELRGSGARVGGLPALRRGEITPAGARSPAPATFGALANRFAPARTAQMGPDVAIPSDRALLVPEDTVTYRELRRRAKNGTTDNVSPRTAELPRTVPRAWRPLADPRTPTPFANIRARVTREPPSGPHFPYLNDGGPRRAIAVVDGTRLGPRCSELRFVRMLYGRRARVRGHPRSGSDFDLAARENVANHRLCAQLVTYSVPADDRERYLFRLYPATR